ncbi:MAG: Rrf2 family transcriptional regulator [Elusimicrobia bacterium]|nr:Rrf2 family transcriptional regulator [Elusimicrobiota bacterium]
MDGCLKLTLNGRYALSAMLLLAWHSSEFPSESRWMTIEDLAKKHRVPKPFLAKIIRPLVKKRLLSSKRGVTGGVALTREPKDISLLEMIEACEGSYARTFCIYFPWRKCSGQHCPIFCHLRKMEEETIEKLRTISMEDLACSMEEHPIRKGTAPKKGDSALFSLGK